MTDMDKLYGILAATTAQIRKGANIDARKLERVDCHFIDIAVDHAKAKSARADLINILNNWPNDQLAGGPSYIDVGATIGDQGAAFQLFALGEVLGLWSIITPKKLGLDDETAESFAGAGLIMMTGYRRANGM